MINERDELIWMAGFFDGEGCAGIARMKNKGARGGFAYAIQVAISQKVPAPLALFKARFGGHFYDYQLHGIKYWRWCLGSDACRTMLEQMLPYLIVKREIAEVVIRYHSRMKVWYAEHGATGYPEHVRAERSAFFFQAREMNARNKSTKLKPAGLPQSLKAANGEG